MADKPKRRILVVEDDGSTRELLARVLAADYTVELASGGDEALAALDAGPIDVIISDHLMPGMTGVELLARAHGIYPEIGRILITASEAMHDARDAVNVAHVHRLLVKPFRPLQLAPIVADVLHEVSQERRCAELTALYGPDGEDSPFGTASPGAMANTAAPQVTFIAVDIDRANNESPASPESLAALLRRVSETESPGELCCVGSPAGAESECGSILLILPGTDRSAAVTRAERLRAAADPPGGPQLALSIGVASPPDDGADMCGLARSACQAMGRVKRQGGGRVR